MSWSPRQEVFLGEMGLGARWTLRDASVGAEALEQVMEEVLAPAPAPLEVLPLQAQAEPVIAAEPPPATMPAPVSTPVPAMAAAPLAEEPAADTSTAWFDDVPAAPPAPAPTKRKAVTDAEIAAMDWPALQAAVSSCTRCALSASRRNAVPGRGPAQAAWIAIVAAPSRDDEEQCSAVAGEAGKLLDNMLRAAALKPEADVYITHLVKCRAVNADGAERNPTVDELTACRPYLDRELALSGALQGMTFGQFAAKGLMLGPAARGTVMRYGATGLPVVATYHPDDLLRRPQDKAKAWGDLCLARTARD